MLRVHSPKQGRGGQRNRGGKRGRTGAKNYGKGGKRKPKKYNRGSQSTEISRKPERHHGRSKSSGNNRAVWNNSCRVNYKKLF